MGGDVLLQLIIAVHKKQQAHSVSRGLLGAQRSYNVGVQPVLVNKQPWQQPREVRCLVRLQLNENGDPRQHRTLGQSGHWGVQPGGYSPVQLSLTLQQAESGLASASVSKDDKGVMLTGHEGCNRVG
jgi:hypothetical protein